MRTATASNFARHWSTVSEAEQGYWERKLARTGDYVSFLQRHGFRAPARTLAKVRNLVRAAQSAREGVEAFNAGDW